MNKLTQFVNACNRHPLRIENGLTPLQLWHGGLLLASAQLQNDIASGLSVNEYGVDLGVSGDLHHQERVIVPEIGYDLNESELHYVQEHFNLSEK